MNDGEVKNQGFEMVLGYQKQFKNGPSVSANANFSYAKNKVLEYDEPLLGKDYAYRTRTTGFSLGQNWGYIIDHSYDPEKGRDGTGFFYSDESIAKSGLTYEHRNPETLFIKISTETVSSMTVTRLPLAIPPYCLASTTVSLYLPTGKDSMFLSCCRE